MMKWNARLYQLLYPDEDVQKCIKEADSMQDFLNKLRGIGKLKEYLKYVKAVKDKK